MNEILKLLFDNGLDTLEKDGKILVCSEEAAKARGFASAQEAIGGRCCYDVESTGDSAIPFDPLIADEIEQFLSYEVFPTILRTGGYVNDPVAFAAVYLPFADEQTKEMFYQICCNIPYNSRDKEETCGAYVSSDGILM